MAAASPVLAAYASPAARLAALRSGTVQLAGPVALDFAGPREALAELRGVGAGAGACERCRVREGGRVTLHACSRCRRVRYCGRACQAADWRAHKASCAASPQ